MLSKCPEGYYRAGNECLQKIEEAASCFCPDGYFEENGRCVELVPVALVPFCEAGALREALCDFIEHHLFEEKCYCPEGFVEEKGECVTYEMYDCTGEWSKKSIRHMGRTERPMAKVNGRSYMNVHCNGEEDCEEEVKLVHQTCEKKTICDMIVERNCPLGTVEEHGCCVLRFSRSAIMRCPAMGDVANCYRQKFASFEWECPAGFRMVGKKCMAEIKADLLWFCQEGTIMMGDQCVCQHDALQFCKQGKLVDGACCLVEKAPPTVSYLTTCIGAGCVPEPIEKALDLCNASDDVPACVVEVEEKFGCAYDDGVRRCMH